MFPLELPSNGHGRSYGGISFPLLAQTPNLLPKPAHPPKPVLDLEQPPEIPVPHCCLWGCCCVSLQPAIGAHNAPETNSSCSQQRLHEEETCWCIFCWFWGSTEPGAVIKQCLRPACPAEILTSRVAQPHSHSLGKGFSQPPSLCSQAAFCSLRSLVWQTHWYKTRCRFFFCNCSLSNSLLRSESLLFCSFFCQCWNYFFFYVLSLLRGRRQILWQCTFYIAHEVWFASLWLHQMQFCLRDTILVTVLFLWLCNHMEAAFDLFSV